MLAILYQELKMMVRQTGCICSFIIYWLFIVTNMQGDEPTTAASD
jgi:hypothetical protein